MLRDSFAIWYLRTSYLANIKDGIGERLINVDPSVLNNPAFRAAGWTANAADIKRTYSPPIPTAFMSEYFQVPTGAGLQRVNTLGDDEEEGGMVTGRTSNDTIAPGPTAAKRRRRREHVEDDDSSDLSDESDEDMEGAQRAAQQIRFAKMPVRQRSDSSPIRSLDRKDGPEVLITSPSRPSTERLRRGSLGAVEAVKARARRDTATSSELSSENELDPSYFQRRKIGARNDSRSAPISEQTQGIHGADRYRNSAATGALHEDSDDDSVGSALSSELGETLDSAGMLRVVDVSSIDNSSTPPLFAGIATSSPTAPAHTSTRKIRSTSLFQELPPARPISVVEPVSLLGSALRARKAKPRNPIEPFANLSGKGSPNPLWIKIYAPLSEDPETPYEMPLARTSKDGVNVTVAEAIGLALWRYTEEGLKPAFDSSKLNVNKWTMRMVEDGEVDFDFPALTRTKPMAEFTANNNRGARGRSRERPFDEFALVEATAQQAQDNHKVTPKYTPVTQAEEDDNSAPTNSESNGNPRLGPNKVQVPRQNPVLGGGPFASALNNTSLTPADRPAAPSQTATPRMGVTKTLRIRYLDVDISTLVMTMDITTDSYIAEILDHVCKRWNLDKAGFVLKVSNTNTVAPLDRTIEALGPRSDLDLVRRRFGAGPRGLTGSPGSSSPNAPLLIDIQGPTKSKKGQMLHPLAHKQDHMSSASNYKKYTVIRKQLTSFRQDNQRILAFDGDFLHIMPGETGKGLFDSSAQKTTSIAFADVQKCKVSTKHSKIIRLVVRRPTEAKRYDFEAKDKTEAHEIVDEILKEVKLATEMMA